MMKKKHYAKNFGLLTCLVCLVSFLQAKPDASMMAPEERMKEWNDWKFGMFIHWGAWSQTEIGYIWHITREESPKEREKSLQLYKTFNPVKFNAREWAKAANNAGMKYVVFVTKHHDGFCNFETAYTDLKITNPECLYSQSENPDIVRQIVEAFRAEGLAVGFYFSHLDWYHSAARRFSVSHWEYDPSLIDTNPELWKACYEFEKGQVQELLTNYGDVDIFWFDIHWPSAKENGAPYEHLRIKKDMTELVKMMRTINPQLIINNRGVDIYGDFATPEQRIPNFGYPGYWESNITISNDRGFWYKGKDVTYKTRKELIHMLVDIASKGGNFLLNVGPSPEGTLTLQELDRLQKMGNWMATNGESIYGTTRTVFRQLDWGRCTMKDKTMYLHVFEWPENGKLPVPGLKSKIASAYLLADKSKTPLNVKKSKRGITINVGKKSPDPDCSVVVVKLKGKPKVENRIRQSGKGSVELRAGEAVINKNKLKYYHGSGTRAGNYIENWTSVDEGAKWTLWIDKPGKFDVEICYGCPEAQKGSEYLLKVKDNEIISTVKATTKQRNLVGKDKEMAKEKIGQITLKKAGKYELVVLPKSIKKDELMRLRSITLKATDNK